MVGKDTAFLYKAVFFAIFFKKSKAFLLCLRKALVVGKSFSVNYEYEK
jgi:hypothetical protein